jgi:hypothetical protein
LDLSSDNSKLNGTTTEDITGAKINIGTSSSIVDISGQISLNKVANLTATDITADNVFVDAFFGWKAIYDFLHQFICYLLHCSQ